MLYQITEYFANVAKHSDQVSDSQIGSVLEELISKFAEVSNEAAREHFTPCEVVKLMIYLQFIEDYEFWLNLA